MSELPPELLNVTSNDLLLEVWTDPKLRLDGLAVSEPGATPVPDKVQVIGWLDALEVTETDPDAFPADCGAKVTLKLVLCPAFTVTGVVMPLNVNPAPVIED